jgi:hypothetical protein
MRWHSFALAYVVWICSFSMSDSSMFLSIACRCADERERCRNLAFAPAIVRIDYEGARRGGTESGHGMPLRLADTLWGDIKDWGGTVP